MRYVRIFLLHCEDIFEARSRALVWFLVTVVNPLGILFYWQAALQGGKQVAPGWDLSTITSYYFLLIIVGSFLMSNIEKDVSNEDIQEGGLVKYLVRPFSYYFLKFFEEIPYRMLQGFFGLFVCIAFMVLFGSFFTFVKDPLGVVFAIAIACMAYLLSFTFKLIVGLLGFWFTDMSGLHQLVEMVLLVFAGYILPLHLLPGLLSSIAQFLPFGYMIYFPVLALQGKLTESELLIVLLAQICWLVGLYLAYKVVWQLGMRKFVAIGQ